MASHVFFDRYLQKAGVKVDGDNPYDIHINDPSFFKKLRINPSLAAGEAYMAGQWDCKQLDELFFKLCRTFPNSNYYPLVFSVLRSIINKLFNFQTRIKSKQVAHKHYNLGNELYQYMLGPSMAYTCGYWKNAQTLDQAQFDKFELVCKKLNLKPGERVLELGCGWGTFAKYAAERYGVKVTAVNISEEQVKYARANTKGLPVDVVLCDYREDRIYNPTKAPFDKVVSIGLCEHVGTKNYRNFLHIVKINLKENGLFLLHTIGKNFSYNYVDPWINKYIFPNGILPSLKELTGAMEHAFILEDLHNFGADYDKTLMAWHKNFNDNWNLIQNSYGETFYRMWNYYLLSCAGAFRSRTMQLWQLVLSPYGVLNGYESIR